MKAAATLKGVALMMACDTGLCPRAKSADGWNIKPFLDFWERFEPMLLDALKDAETHGNVLNHESGNSAGNTENQAD